MEQEMSEASGSLLGLPRPVFKRWEKLRLLYNALLLAVFVAVYGLDTALSFSWPIVVMGLAGAVLANICYLAGPFVETYVSWLGLRWKYTTAALFVIGVLVSVPCVMLFPGVFFFGM